MEAYARMILKERYLRKGETINGMFRRVAKAVAKGKKQEKEFYSVMQRLEFLPNSPCLMNAGTKDQQMSACFVLPIEDSIDSIFRTLSMMAMIHKSGGGTGFSFSRLRPREDIINSAEGGSSGPISFIEIYDKTTDVIKQGGKRRGANMAVLRVDHPDILEFINCKKDKFLSTFNISVAITDEFVKAVNADSYFFLKNPRNGKKTKVKARKIFDAIVKSAWERGDPGVLFIDEIDRMHPLKEMVESTNPCGEVPLLPYESCNLGSLNLSKFVVKGKIDWHKIDSVVRIGVNFLDNAIDKTDYPYSEIEKKTKQSRKIGIGVMGLAEMFILLGIEYGSDESVKIAETVMDFIQLTARDESAKLGKKYGSFPMLKKSKLKYKYMRNATVTSIAPTGTISLIAETSSGIEPLFGVCYSRKAFDGKILFIVNSLFRKMARPNAALLKKIANNDGSLKGLHKLGGLFKTIYDVDAKAQLRIQSVMQRHVDNSISKTVNLPNSAKLKEVSDVFMTAYEMRCKGVTVYRNRSRLDQILLCKVCK